MDYISFIIGIILLAVFSWILYRNRKRAGLIHGWLRIETIAGIFAGAYLILTSTQAMLLQ